MKINFKNKENEKFLSLILDKKLKFKEKNLDFTNNKIHIGFNNEKLEYLGYYILKYIEENNIENINILAENDEYLFKVLEGFELGSYKFNKYLTENKKNKIKEVNFIFKNIKNFEKKYKDFLIIKENIFLCRDLVNEPSNIINPETYSEICKQLTEYGIEVEILGEKDMSKLGMNALLAVGQGSSFESKLIVLKWNGINDKNFKDPVALVGKGVTFDSGGISIKPDDAMYDMKCDMAGSAVVVSTIKLLAQRKAKLNAVGVIAIVENMPSGSSIKPGDIIKSMSKQTIEILHTDAEGRLILADALYYTKTRFNPKVMIDLATLTGACCVALGSKNAGIFTNNDKLSKEIEKASIETSEYVWRMPIDELGGTYDKMMNSNIADVKNISGVRLAGAITAAQFLQRFIDKHKNWAHIDIAGTAFLTSSDLYSAKEIYTIEDGATGYGIKLLNNLIKNNYENI